MLWKAKLIIVAAALKCTGLLALPAVAASLGPANLRVEYLYQPLGVDLLGPRFFWQDVSKCARMHVKLPINSRCDREGKTFGTPARSSILGRCCARDSRSTGQSRLRSLTITGHAKPPKP